MRVSSVVRHSTISRVAVFAVGSCPGSWKSQLQLAGGKNILQLISHRSTTLFLHDVVQFFFPPWLIVPNWESDIIGMRTTESFTRHWWQEMFWPPDRSERQAVETLLPFVLKCKHHRNIQSWQEWSDRYRIHPTMPLFSWNWSSHSRTLWTSSTYRGRMRLDWCL